MDWQAILDVALSDGVNAKRADFMSNALLQLIPDRPSKKADVEWLKERGWRDHPRNSGWLCTNCGSLEWHPANVGVRTCSARLFVLNGEMVRNPTRVAVALFEAAVKASKS